MDSSKLKYILHENIDRIYLYNKIVTATIAFHFLFNSIRIYYYNCVNSLLLIMVGLLML